MSTSPIIDVQDLWFRYTDESPWVVQGVTLAIEPGEFVAVIGQNGAGKTTLVKHFNGILQPVKGTVRVSGRLTSEIPFREMATQVGYCYQNPDHQIFNLTVRSELEFGPRHLGVPEDKVHARVDQVLETISLTAVADEYPFALSRGDRQKVAVGSILAMNPPVMIVDEPTTGMDWRGGVNMMNLIRDLHEAGHTVIMITHDMRIVTAYASRVVVMSQGKVLADDTPHRIFRQRDVLHEAFIEPPQITRICQALAELGIPDDILTIDEAVAAYTRVLAGAQTRV